MPSYRAKSPGFMFGELYAPNSRREIVITDKPLKPVPAWLEPVANTVGAKEAKKRAARKTQSKKDIEEKKKELDAVNFLDTEKPVSPTQKG